MDPAMSLSFESDLGGQTIRAFADETLNNLLLI